MKKVLYICTWKWQKCVKGSEKRVRKEMLRSVETVRKEVRSERKSKERERSMWKEVRRGWERKCCKVETCGEEHTHGPSRDPLYTVNTQTSAVVISHPPPAENPSSQFIIISPGSLFYQKRKMLNSTESFSSCTLHSDRFFTIWWHVPITDLIQFL